MKQTKTTKNKRQVVEPECHKKYSEDSVKRVEYSILPTATGDTDVCRDCAVGNDCI